MNHDHNIDINSESLNPTSERPDILLRLTDLANSTGDNASLRQHVVGEVARLFNALGALMFVYNEDGELEETTSIDLSVRFTREVVKLGRTEWVGQYLAGSVRPVEIAIAPGSRQPSPIHRLCASEGYARLLSLPLRARGVLLGVLVVFSSEAHALTQETLDQAGAVANIVALAMYNQRLVESRNWERKAQDKFLDALNHELRTPLTSIMGFTQMLRKRLSVVREVDGRALEQLDLLWAQEQRLNRLLETFVDIANIERGEFVIDRARIDVVAMVRSSVRQSVEQIRSSHEVRLQLPDTGIWVDGDARRLEHVFIHVVSNAMRYSLRGKPITVTVAGQPQRSQVVLSVCDEGPGISSESRREVFKRFYPSESRKAGGMGMGLYASKAVIEAHGGRLYLDSDPGQGTTVTITLPLAERDETDG